MHKTPVHSMPNKDMTTYMKCKLNREESKSKYQKTRAGRVGRPNACNTKKKNENCNKKARKNMCENARPVHKMVAVTFPDLKW